MVKQILFSSMIAVLLSFTSNTNIESKLPPTVPKTWGATTSSGGETVRIAVDFVSTSNTTITAVRIFNPQCQQYVISSRSGSWVVAGSGYKTSTGGFGVTYTDSYGNTRTAALSGVYPSQLSPCDGM